MTDRIPPKSPATPPGDVSVVPPGHSTLPHLPCSATWPADRALLTIWIGMSLLLGRGGEGQIWPLGLSPRTEALHALSPHTPNPHPHPVTSDTWRPKPSGFTHVRARGAESLPRGEIGGGVGCQPQLIATSNQEEGRAIPIFHPLQGFQLWRQGESSHSAGTVGGQC